MLGRRELLAAGAAFALLPQAFAALRFEPRPGAPRNFALTTQIDIRNPGKGPCQAWIPLPQRSGFEFQRMTGNDWNGNGALVRTEHDSHSGADFLHVVWADGETAPTFTVTSRFATRDRFVDLGEPGAIDARLTAAERNLYLRPTRLLPTDGPVATLAARVTRGAHDDLAKVRAIYEWLVENAYRDAKVRGCGSGDVLEMVRSDNYGGKCADLNGLFVALCRAAGIPARDVYGIRIAPSRFGYKSLGANSATVTKAQHCRAEVFLDRHGWVPMDPADVRKVMLEEQEGGLPITDEKVVAARATLFGAWEGNWLAYNSAHDLRLPGSAASEPNGFLMYPEVEIAGERRDCLLPDTVAYTITATEEAA